MGIEKLVSLLQLARIPAAIFLIATFAACTKPTGLCETDEQCSPTGMVCDLQSHLCTNPTVRVVKIGAGDGLVISDPPGIECGGRCEASFPIQQNVRLRATATDGSYLKGWPGACASATTCLVEPGPRQEVTVRFERKQCSPAGWCWENPLPGRFGLWRRLWGTSSKDIWAAGSSLMHYDGESWSEASRIGADAIWGSSPTDIWVGSSNEIYHYDGTSWSLSPSSRGLKQYIIGIWGSGPDDVWAVGQGKDALHFDGEKWSVQSTTFTGDTTDVWGTGRNDVWAVDGRGSIHHFDGKQWKISRDNGKGENPLWRVWGRGPQDVWVTGKYTARYQNGAWTVLDDPLNHPVGSFYDVWGSGPSDVWVSGYGRQIYRYDGRQWSKTPFPSASPQGSLISGLWGSDARDVWAVDEFGKTYRWPGNNPNMDAWGERVNLPDFFNAWGTDPDNLWAVGSDDSRIVGVIYHWDGVHWSKSYTARYGIRFLSVWGSDRNNIWAGSTGKLFRWQGSSWIESDQDVGNKSINAIWGTSSRDIWYVGDAGTILHWDGSGFVAFTDPSYGDLKTIWGIGNDVWAAGGIGAGEGSGTIVRFKDGKWSPVNVPSGTARLTGVGGRSINDVWAVGLSGKILRLSRAADGTETWSAVPSGTSVTLTGVFGGSTSLWAVGYSGVILRWDGASWLPEDSGTRNYLYGIFGLGSSQVWSVGQAGTILRYQPR